MIQVKDNPSATRLNDLMSNLYSCPPHRYHQPANASGPQRRIAIVGNAPPVCDMAKTIDSADFVIRFNQPLAFGAQYGERLDLLCLINSGGQAEEWLRNATLTQTEYFKACRQVLFPNHPTILDRYHPQSIALAQGGATSHLTEELKGWIETAGKPVEVVSKALYLQTFISLKLPWRDLNRCWLSSGILATAHALAHADENDRIEIYGFSWQGWEGHPWASEKAWYVAAQQRAALWLAT